MPTDREKSITWARNLLQRGNWLILDTETTALFDAEILQIGVLAPTGHTLLDVLLRPERPIPADATAIHGLTDAIVAPAFSFPHIYAALKNLLQDREVIIYNAPFDCSVIDRQCERVGLPVFDIDAHCAMREYARYIGQWNAHHRNYRWHPLPGGDHSAIGDCRAVLKLIHQMAELPDPALAREPI